MRDGMFEYIKNLADSVSPVVFHSQVTTLLLLLCIAVAAVVAYYLTKGFLMLFERVITHSPTKWDDDLLNDRFTRALSQLSPALVVSWMLPRFFGDGVESVGWIDVVTSLYILWAIVYIIVIFLNNLYDAMAKREALRPYAVKGIFQMFKLIIIGIGVIIGLSLLIGKTPIAILTALGASAAVLSLVFKDTILGLVASIQLTANKMLERGDWITVPNRDLNGEVIDVSLTTVKVRNWDNSVTTVPPYSLITDSFRNYKPMQVSGGRRVDRAIYIDVNTVRFLDEAEISALAADGLIAPSSVGSGRREVNLGLLRGYIEHYLATHADVNPELTLMVRQLAPTPSGLPVQLYFFTRSTEWIVHEHVAADIFDHVYATIGRFGLSIFQTPAGTDLARREKASQIR